MKHWGLCEEVPNTKIIKFQKYLHYICNTNLIRHANTKTQQYIQCRHIAKMASRKNCINKFQQKTHYNCITVITTETKTILTLQARCTTLVINLSGEDVMKKTKKHERPEIMETDLPPMLQPEHKPGLPWFSGAFEQVLELVVAGNSLRKICRDNKHIPTYSRMIRWIFADEDRKKRYEDAQMLGAEILADEMLDIADGTNDTLSDVQRDNLRINTRKQLLAWRNRDKYGDKKQIETHTTINLAEAMERARERTSIPPPNVIDVTPDE